ncbi:hypothetical protein Tco_1285046 [Tanacetum coccineum]
MLAELRKMFEKPPAVDIRSGKVHPYSSSILQYKKGRDNKSNTARKQAEKRKGKADKNKKLGLLNQCLVQEEKGKILNKDQVCHHCHMLGFNAERKLAYWVNICIYGHGAHAVVEAIGTLNLPLLQDSHAKLQSRRGLFDLLGYSYCWCGPRRTVYRNGASYFYTLRMILSSLWSSLVA